MLIRCVTIVTWMISLPEIRLRTIDCGLLVILEVTLTLWPTGLGRTMTVLGCVSVSCCWLSLQCVRQLVLLGILALCTCLPRRCSTTIMLMLLTIVLRLSDVATDGLRLLGSRVVGL